MGPSFTNHPRRYRVRKGGKDTPANSPYNSTTSRVIGDAWLEKYCIAIACAPRLEQLGAIPGDASSSPYADITANNRDPWPGGESVDLCFATACTSKFIQVLSTPMCCVQRGPLLLSHSNRKQIYICVCVYVCVCVYMYMYINNIITSLKLYRKKRMGSHSKIIGTFAGWHTCDP
uniref:Uncharacterized protein n=1 Tax=Sphaerodactylus townsendi TaxID=933632 RepID=A0ACB8F216_9SAUR